MNYTYSQDLLSILFMAFIAIIIAAIVFSMAPTRSGLMVPTFVLISVCLWIAYDYITRKRARAHRACHAASVKNINAVENKLPEDVDQLVEEIRNDVDPNKVVEAPQSVVETKPEREHSNEIDIDLYNKDILANSYDAVGCTADNELCKRMIYTGKQPQMSQIYRARHNKYTMQPYFEEELREAANRDWWNSDFLEGAF